MHCRILGRIGIGVALGAASGVLAAPPARATEATAIVPELVLSQPIQVAERGGRGRGRGGWKGGRSAGDAMLRELRQAERAARGALERIGDAATAPLREEWSPEPTPPAAPPLPAPSLRPEAEPETALGTFEEETAAAPAPGPATAPADVAPPAEEPARLAPGPPPPVGPAASHATRLVPAGVLLAALLLLLAALVRRRRTAAPADDATRPTVATRAGPHAVAAAALAAEAAPPPLPAGGRYEILAEVGRGAMGVVYRARDRRLDREVALKRLPDELRQEQRYVELLLREARSAARLNHRNIVTVHDVDHEDGAWFIVMELLEGESIAAIFQRRGRFTARAVVWLAEQALAGLGYAHARGIVHRDVKPANLFLTRDRTLKLMDFGVAKIVEEARRKRTLIGGTPAYMAPEQAAGRPVDGRADLYALGASCFELLTGAAVFSEGDPLFHHRHTAPPDPRERTPDVPHALAELVVALLAKRPEDRPASAAEVAKRLQAILASRSS